MAPEFYSIVEMVFSAVVVLGFLLWQLYSVSQAKRRRIAREEAERQTEGDGRGPT